MPSKAKQLRPPVESKPGLELSDVFDRLSSHERPFDEEWLTKVYQFAESQHRDQLRRSGEPYITHPLAVAYLLADLDFDETCVAVGLLHDVLEDTGVERAALADSFGDEIAHLVDGVSKIGRHSYVRRDEAQAETFRKLILASAKDIRVIVVKLADRLHNMQTLGPMPTDKKRRIARETLEIYAPIAHRLGMSMVRGQLEDLAFFHLYPHQFAELQASLDQRVKLGRGATRRIREQLAEVLDGAGVECEISHRVKGYYSIYQKLRRQDIDLGELYDYLAFRILVSEVKDCYSVLGVAHQTWRPIPGRFKDYIAVPKPNLYQSLHTTLVGEQGQPFEVQIRTYQMDRVAEEGIAAHWRYKEGAKAESDPNILWLRQLLEWQQEVKDPRTFLNTLKIDLYPDEVYVFTPKGDVFSFPRGATPLDFAYRVHTDIGHHCAGARVNGRLVPLRTTLSNGDIVEIVNNPNREPSRDWLNLAVTPRAKSKIRHWLNTQQRERAVEIGRSIFEREVRRSRLSPKKVIDSQQMGAYLKSEGLSGIEDLFSKIGFGKTSTKQVTSRVLSEQELEKASEPPSRLRKAVNRILPFGESSVAVKGHGDLLAYLAKCCNPLPGEPIVGYVTRGRGVAVHASECPNVKNLLYHPEREIEVEWSRQKESGGTYRVPITIRGGDSPGLLARLTESISKQQANILSLDANTEETGRASVDVIVELRNRKQLDKLCETLRGLSGISSVERRMSGEGGDSSSNRSG